MRLVPTLESQARPAVRPSAAPRVTHAHQDFLPFLHVAAHDLREVPIADAGLHRDGGGLALRPVQKRRPENAPWRASCASVSSVSYVARWPAVRMARIWSRVPSRMR